MNQGGKKHEILEINILFKREPNQTCMLKGTDIVDIMFIC